MPTVETPAGQNAPAAGAAQQLQWGAVDVTAEQFQPMVDFAANVLGLTAVTGL